MEARRHLGASVANLATQRYGTRCTDSIEGTDTATLLHGVIIAAPHARSVGRQEDIPWKLTTQLYSVWRDRTRGFRILLLGTEFGICR